jgi:hypothetical protein
MNTTATTFVCVTRGFQLYQNEDGKPDRELYLSGHKDGVEAEWRVGDEGWKTRVLNKTELHALIVELFHDDELATALDSHFDRLSREETGSAQVVSNSLVRRLRHIVPQA